MVTSGVLIIFQFVCGLVIKNCIVAAFSGGKHFLLWNYILLYLTFNMKNKLRVFINTKKCVLKIPIEVHDWVLMIYLSFIT